MHIIVEGRTVEYWIGNGLRAISATGRALL
jgi:hypothetical protein